jgi:ArsR family transcriptional regulator, virulence genes transcriptional regulator
MSYFDKSEITLLGNARMMIRAAAHPLRERILTLIKDNNNRIHVSPIYKKLRIEQSVASQHLAILRRANLVVTKKEGKIVYYSVNDAAIKHLLKTSEEMVGLNNAPSA